MHDTKLRAWWAHRQGLDGTFNRRSASEVLGKTGWARSVGGSGPYLTLFSRAGLSRDAIDAAVARLEIHELPSARSCTYVLPASDFALGLRLAQNSSGETKTAEKLGVTGAEIDKLCDAVLSALKNAPLDPDEIRKATGSACRNLGAEGKKKGLTTTLPVALGKLQVQGDIRRIPVNGRLDQQRYRYALWRPNPLAKTKLSFEEASAELARRFFHWNAPATLAEFQQFAGTGVKAAKAAVDPLRLVPLAPGSDLLVFAEDREQYDSFTVPKQPSYSLISSLDAIILCRFPLAALLDPADAKRKILGDKKPIVLGDAWEPPSHAILDRGRVVGLWEFDPQKQAIAWTSFIAVDKALKEAVARTETFVREQLGDVRSFSLDSPASRVPRIEAIRKMQAGR